MKNKPRNGRKSVPGFCCVLLLSGNARFSLLFPQKKPDVSLRSCGIKPGFPCRSRAYFAAFAARMDSIISGTTLNRSPQMP